MNRTDPESKRLEMPKWFRRAGEPLKKKKKDGKIDTLVWNMSATFKWLLELLWMGLGLAKLRYSLYTGFGAGNPTWCAPRLGHSHGAMGFSILLVSNRTSQAAKNSSAACQTLPEFNECRN